MRRLGALGVKMIFVKDTPLMSVVSTIPACALQIKVFGESICKVTLQQDLHTRQRQDEAFAEIQKNFGSVSSWDPLPIVYENHPSVDVLDQDGRYKMWDWNHITQYQSEKLSKDFAPFFIAATE